MVTLSAMINFIMAPGVAPIDFRIPNSCVRSLTVISMMFDTPTIPPKSVSMPNIQSALRMMLDPLFICWFCVKRFQIHKAPSSSGAALCDLLMTAL